MSKPKSTTGSNASPSTSAPPPAPKINFSVDIECMREELCKFEGSTTLPDMNFACTFDPPSKQENWQTSHNFQTQEVAWTTKFSFSPDWETCKNILQNPFRLKVNSIPPPPPSPSKPQTPTTAKAAPTTKKDEKGGKTTKSSDVPLECLELICVKLSDLFFDGKTTVATWSSPEKGVKQLTVKISLEGSKITELTPPDVAFLLITLVSVHNLPSEPHSFKDLDEFCLPVYLAFDMWSEGGSQYMSTEALPHANTVHFGHDHVLTAPSMQILLAKAKSSKLLIQVRDRDLKGVSHTQIDGRKVVAVDANPQSVPHGIAMFDLYPVFDGPRGDAKLTANVLPQSPTKKLHNDDPKGFHLLEGRYGESNTQLRLRVRYHVREAQISQPFMTAVLMCKSPPIVPSFLTELVPFIQSTNAQQLSPETLAGVSAEDLELRDFLSGFIVDDGERAVVCIEGLPSGVDSLWSQFASYLESGSVVGLRSDQTRYEARRYVGSHSLGGRGLVFWNQQYITGYPIEVKTKDDSHKGEPTYEYYGLFRHARLIQPIRVTLQQKSLYLKDTCGPLAFGALNNLYQIFDCRRMKEVESSGLLPSFEALERLWVEYGAPPSHVRDQSLLLIEGQPSATQQQEIPEEIRNEEEASKAGGSVDLSDDARSVVDNYNDKYVQWKRQKDGETKDYISANKKYPASIQKPRPKSTYSFVPELPNGEVYIYSNQRLNVTELQKKLIQEKAASDPAHYYTYSHSTLTGTVTQQPRSPSSLPCSPSNKKPFSVTPARDPSEFIKHSKKPPEYRIDELKQEYRDHVEWSPVRNTTNSPFLLFPSHGGTFEKDPTFFKSIHLPDPVVEAEKAQLKRPTVTTTLKIATKSPSTYQRAGSPLIDKWSPSRQIRADPPAKESLKFKPVEIPPLSLVEKQYEDSYRRPFSEFNTYSISPKGKLHMPLGQQPPLATTDLERNFRNVINHEKDVPLSHSPESKRRPIVPLTEKEKANPLFVPPRKELA